MNNILKVIGAILVLYSIVAGMLVPLNTGVYQVEQIRVKAGPETRIDIQAYNSDYTDAAAIQSRIRLDSNIAICAERVVVNDAQSLTLFFDIPVGELPLAKAVDNEKIPFPLLEIEDRGKGIAVLESAVYIEQVAGAAPVADDFCEVVAYTPNPNITYPYLNILQETIKNLYYHVPMWFGMLLILFTSVIYSILQLRKPEQIQYDIRANSLAVVGLMYGLIGIATGALWAKHTWGAYWSFDVKQNTTAVALLIYLAYFVLRSSFDDTDKRARISAIYNIFAFATLIPLLYVVPRMVDSLHPGATGNPGFNTYDLDSTMRAVFYPAVIGWILMGFWFADILTRIEKIKYKQLDQL